MYHIDCACISFVICFSVADFSLQKCIDIHLVKKRKKINILTRSLHDIKIRTKYDSVTFEYVYHQNCLALYKKYAFQSENGNFSFVSVALNRFFLSFISSQSTWFTICPSRAQDSRKVK